MNPPSRDHRCTHELQDLRAAVACHHLLLARQRFELEYMEIQDGTNQVVNLIDDVGIVK
jgi:hypothetical protein